MSLSGLFSTIEAHLTAAGAAQTPPIVQIIPGEPQAIPNAPEIAYWYLGNSPWESNTLSFTQRRAGIHWEVYFPGSIRSNAVDRDLELRVAAIAFAIEAQFMGDVGMGGNATGEGLEMTDPAAGWTDFAGTMCRTVGGDIWFYLSNVTPIAV